MRSEKLSCVNFIAFVLVEDSRVFPIALPIRVEVLTALCEEFLVCLASQRSLSPEPIWIQATKAANTTQRLKGEYLYYSYKPYNH